MTSYANVYNLDNLQDGTVTSVSLTAPGDLLAAGGSPITTSGTLTLSKPNTAANLVYSGPAAGPAAPATFRALVAADIPAGVGIQTLAEVLVQGNVTGGTDIVISTADTLSFQTAGTINTVSGTDDISVVLGAGNTLAVNKTINTTEQNGGAARSTGAQQILTGPGNTLLGSAWVSEYSYDDGGASVVDTAAFRIYLRKTLRNYAITLHVRARSAIPPFSVLIPHYATVQLNWADNGITPVNWLIGRTFFAPNGNPANTEFSIEIAGVIRTTAAAGQWIEALIVRPPIGRYDVLGYHLSAYIIN